MPYYTIAAIQFELFNTMEYIYNKNSLVCRFQEFIFSPLLPHIIAPLKYNAVCNSQLLCYSNTHARGADLKGVRRVVDAVHPQTVAHRGLWAAKHSHLQPLGGAVAQRFAHEGIRARLAQQQVAPSRVQEAVAGSRIVLCRHHFLRMEKEGLVQAHADNNTFSKVCIKVYCKYANVYLERIPLCVKYKYCYLYLRKCFICLSVYMMIQMLHSLMLNILAFVITLQENALVYFWHASMCEYTRKWQ